MHRSALTIPLLSLALLAACGNGNGSAPAAQSDEGAATAQVADAAEREVREIGPFKAETIATFNEPWALSFLPDGRLLVSERPGALKLVDVASGRAGDIGGLPEVVYGVMPLMRPVSLSCKPLGRFPLTSAKVYGAAPTVAASWAV